MWFYAESLRAQYRWDLGGTVRHSIPTWNNGKAAGIVYRGRNSRNGAIRRRKQPWNAWVGLCKFNGITLFFCPRILCTRNTRERRWACLFELFMVKFDCCWLDLTIDDWIWLLIIEFDYWILNLTIDDSNWLLIIEFDSWWFSLTIHELLTMLLYYKFFCNDFKKSLISWMFFKITESWARHV